MAAPSVPSSYPAPITATGEANGVLINLSQVSPDGPPATLKVGVSGTYGTATLLVRGRLLGMTNFFPIGGIDATAQTAVGTAGSIALTANTSYIFKFPIAGYDAVEVYASALASGQIDVEQSTGPAESVTPPVVNATTTATALSGNSTVAGTFTITSTSAAALTAGANGATNPQLKVNANTASVATGLEITGAAAAAGLAVAVISSGTNENLTINAKGSGTITIGGTSTGAVIISGNAKTVIAGTLTAGGLLTCGLQIATSGPVIYSGSGAPSISAAVKGSLYLRSDGSSTSTRLYVATDAAGAWAAVTTAS